LRILAGCGPCGQCGGGGDRAHAGLVEQFGGWAVFEEFGHGDLVGPELLVEVCDALGEPDSLGAGGGGGEVFLPGAPAGDIDDLVGTQGASGVDSEVDRAQRSGECVDGSGGFGGHLFPRGEHLNGCPDAVVLAWVTQAGDIQREYGGGDASGVELVGFADPVLGACVHACGFDDLVADRGHVAGQGWRRRSRLLR
jgi:hypothetical protein